MSNLSHPDIIFYFLTLCITSHYYYESCHHVYIHPYPPPSEFSATTLCLTLFCYSWIFMQDNKNLSIGRLRQTGSWRTLPFIARFAFNYCFLSSVRHEASTTSLCGNRCEWALSSSTPVGGPSFYFGQIRSLILWRCPEVLIDHHCVSLSFYSPMGVIGIWRANGSYDHYSS